MKFSHQYKCEARWLTQAAIVLMLAGGIALVLSAIWGL